MMGMTVREASASRLAETISILQMRRANHPADQETIDLHLDLLHARGHVAAELRAAGAADTWVTDWDLFSHLFGAICDISSRHRPALESVFSEFARSDANRLQLVTGAFLRDALGEEITAWPSLLAFVLNNTLHPFFQASAKFEEWMTRKSQEEGYRKECPVCGGRADFAALEKESGARRLLCSRCDAEWTFERTGCPFCREEQPEKLGYYPGGQGAFRLYICDTCRRYLKTIDLRELARPVNLPAERILTVGMDAAALNAGYIPS